MEVDSRGRIKLSIKELLDKPEENTEAQSSQAETSEE